MSIALTEEHQELARVARSFLEAHAARAEARELLDAPSDRLPSFWKEMAELGWMGLHVDEADGGQGFGLTELSIRLFDEPMDGLKMLGERVLPALQDT